MGAPFGNRNAAGSRGGNVANKIRTVLRKSKSRTRLSRLTGRKPRVTKMQLAIRTGRMMGKTPSYAGLSWRTSAARFKSKKKK